MKNVFTKLFSLLCAAVLCISFASCITPPPDNEPGDATTFVGIDINPSIELTLDENGLVVTAYGANEDGKVLLYGEEANIIGKNYEQVAEYITGLAADLGYITEGHKISTTVTSDNAAQAESIQSKLNAKISATAENIGFTVTMTADVAYSLIRELHALKEANPNDTAIQALTPAKYKLVVAATEDGEITVSAAAALDNEQLIAKISEAHSKIEAYAINAYKEAKARAKMLFETAMGVALDGVYNVVYLERVGKLLTNPSYKDTIYYGAVYQAYMTTARTLSSLEDIIEFGDEMTNYEPDQATVSAIATALDIADTSVFENSEGKITLESLVNYVERFLTENDLGEAVEEQVEELLDQAEDAAEMLALASDAYAADLSALKMQIEAMITTINTTVAPVSAFLSSEGRAELDACLADLDATLINITAMMEDGLTEEELDTLIEAAEEKADAMKVKIEADLSAEELERVETLKAQAQQQIQTLTQEFENRLSAAETAARNELSRLKEERRNHTAETAPQE